MYYGIDACPSNSTIKHSFEFTMSKVIFRLFGPMSSELRSDVCGHFGFVSIDEIICTRETKFICRYRNSENLLCKLIDKH